MRYAVPIESSEPLDVPSTGGKAARLATMHRTGIRVPGGVCVTTDAYRKFMESSGLQERVLLELARKPLEQIVRKGRFAG